MNRRICIVAALAALSAVPAAATAVANAARTGSFDAQGTGTLVAQGNIRAFGTIDGRVIVRDPVGTAVVRIGGVRQKPTKILNALQSRRAVKIYNLKKVDDAFFVKGQNVRVELRSPAAALSISATGKGRITVLSGEGTYHVNGGEELQWSVAPLPIMIAPPRPEPRTRPGDDG